MHKGHVDIGHITEEMLYRLKFTEHTHTVYSGGFWKSKGVAVPDDPYEAPWVWQVFEDDCPSWVHGVYDNFSDWLHYGIVTVNKLMPGRFIAPHVDTLYKMRQKVKRQDMDIEGMIPVRVNLFLQDRLMGHYIEIENKTWLDYKKGDYTIIKPDTVHLVANLGYEPRFTMQLTGYAKEEDMI